MQDLVIEFQLLTGFCKFNARTHFERNACGVSQDPKPLGREEKGNLTCLIIYAIIYDSVFRFQDKNGRRRSAHSKKIGGNHEGQERTD